MLCAMAAIDQLEDEGIFPYAATMRAVAWTRSIPRLDVPALPCGCCSYCGCTCEAPSIFVNGKPLQEWLAVQDA